MNEYCVVLSLRNNGREYKPGDTISLDNALATELLASGVISGEAPALEQIAAEETISENTDANLAGGGDDLNSGEPSIDGRSTEDDEDAAKEVGPNAPATEKVEDTRPAVDDDMKRAALEQIAAEEGHSADAIAACENKTSLVSLIEAGRKPAGTFTATEDPSAGL